MHKIERWTPEYISVGFIAKGCGVSSATVYITNADNLAQYLRYLILQIGVYVKNADGGWDKCPQENGAYLTLQNGAVDITLPQPGYYKVTVDSGNYFSFPNDNVHDKQIPQFYMAVVR